MQVQAARSFSRFDCKGRFRGRGRGGNFFGLGGDSALWKTARGGAPELHWGLEIFCGFGTEGLQGGFSSIRLHMEMREFSWLRRGKISPMRRVGQVELNIEVVSSLSGLGMSLNGLARSP